MYSVVLMAALTAGTSAPAWGCGCSGCHGWFGGGCHGCHGLFSGWHGCHGCHGGYSACYGCYGGYGGYGGACYGCSGYGCFGYGCYGYGGYGTGCSGCYGGYACAGSGCYSAPAHPPAEMGAPGAPPGGKAPEQVPAPKKEEKEKTTSTLNQARLIVELPADAKLYVDDRLMKTTSERRVFHSPQLDQGQTYYYILRAEVVRDGQTISDTKRVLVHSGEVVQASFRDLGAVAATRTEPTIAQVGTKAGR